MDIDHIDISTELIDETNIKPNHYRKGKIDLYEAWYQTQPYNEVKATLRNIAHRYLYRDKGNTIEDLEKAIYTLNRLKEYEILEQNKKD